MGVPENLPPPPGAATPEPVTSDGPTGDVVHDRPEILVGGAFVGAFLVGRILKRITS
jgi:hypothetical protein